MDDSPLVQCQVEHEDIGRVFPDGYILHIDLKNALFKRLVKVTKCFVWLAFFGFGARTAVSYSTVKYCKVLY
jgi:hypothetical protein